MPPEAMRLGFVMHLEALRHHTRISRGRLSYGGLLSTEINPTCYSIATLVRCITAATSLSLHRLLLTSRRRVQRHPDALELAHRAVSLVEDPGIHMASLGVFLAAPPSVERTQEEIATHQDVLAKFKERFPKSNMLQSFTIDPDHPLDAIRETLEG